MSTTREPTAELRKAQLHRIIAAPAYSDEEMELLVSFAQDPDLGVRTLANEGMWEYPEPAGRGHSFADGSWQGSVADDLR